MRRSFVVVWMAFAIVTVLARGEEPAALRLPAVIGDNMVLQQDVPLPVWGWAAPGETVTVKVGDQEKKATAGEDGKWTVKLDALKAGGPLEMTIEGKTKIAIKNVLVGEVWVCSGQSNMQWSVGGVQNAQQEIQEAKYPKIRLLQTGYAAPEKPQENCQGKWVEISPQTAGGCTAVGYFFGRKLHTELDVPVGLIQTAVGGTPAESWTSREAMEADPDLKLFAERLDQAVAAYPEAKKKNDEAIADWEKNKDDPASKKDEKGWEGQDLDAGAWKEMSLPQYFEKAGLNMDGVVWFRRTVEIPDGLAGKDLKLSLGPIDDNDVTYFGGEKVGETNGHNIERNYTVPGRLVKAGKAAIAVRVTDNGWSGGLYGKPEQMKLAPAAGGAEGTVALDGSWKYEVASKLRPKPKPPMGPGNAWLPTGLFNGMIAPHIPFAIRGAIWYQGESNAGRAYQYRKLFATMIRDWRKRWGQGDFPFLFVQLANFMAAKPDPGESAWAELREAQLMTLSLPGAGMAVIIDIGEAKDIHPKNKQDVGLRLALWALANTYGKKIVFSGPLYDSMAVEGNAVRLKFKHVGGGLVAKGGEPLKYFAVAGEDKKFVWAEAKIDGETVVVSSDKVEKPAAVRYAWADNPEGCNLFNKEGLPASPFRTDDWPGTTVNSK